MQHKSRIVVASLCAIAVGLAVASCGKKPAAPPPQGPVTVGVVTVQSQAVALRKELPGRTTPFAISEVRPQVGGIVTARLFQEGSMVHAGQPLYQIDPATYRASLNQAQAQLVSAQANATTARLKAGRYTELVKINAVSKQEADDAIAQAAQAAAAVQQNRAAVQQSRISVNYTRIIAPISGRIGRSAFTQGALVTASQTEPLTTIQRLDPIYVDISQSSTDLLKLRHQFASGQLSGGGSRLRVRLKLEDGSEYPLDGRMEFSDVTVDQATGAVNLRAVFPNPSGLLLPGMYVRAMVTDGVAPNGILAPQRGVSRDPKGGATALVVNAQGKVEARNLVLGPAVGSNWLVTSGLRSGDRLIVEGLQKVKPGDAVKVAPASPDPAGSAAADAAR